MPRYKCRRCGDSFATEAGGRRHIERAHPPLAGLVKRSRARSTGTLVGIYRASEAGIGSSEGYPWVTVCEEHSALIEHATLPQARSWSASPESWCEQCQA